MDNTSCRTRCARLMKESGMQVTQIATTLGVHRSTIYRWVNDKGKPKAMRPSKLDPFKEHISTRLRRFNIPATVMIREIREQGYTGGITILKEYMHDIKEQHVRRLVDRFETEPGRQSQMDWGECGTIVHQGRRRRLHLFAFVGGWPGAWLGQRIFHHKTEKLSFRLVFWLIVAAHLSFIVLVILGLVAR